MNRNLRTKKRYAFSICRYVLIDIMKKGISFQFVERSIAIDEYRNLRKDCPCFSGEKQGFAILFCKKHLDEFDQIFFKDVCQRYYDRCFQELHKDIPCSKCITLFRSFIHEDTIRICIHKNTLTGVRKIAVFLVIWMFFLGSN